MTGNLVALLQEGLRHHQAGRLAEAERCYRKVLAGDAGSADALHLLGMVQFARGDLERAASNVERAVRLAPGVAAFHSNLGLIHWRSGRPEQARQSFEQALELDPCFGDALLHLAELLEETGAPEEAEACARRAVAALPGAAGGWLVLGNALRRQGRAEEALDAWRKAIDADAACARAHNNAAALLLEQGRLEEAVEGFRRAVRSDPGWAEAWRNLGAALRARGGHDEALACYREAIQRAPEDVDAHMNLAFALLLTGQFEEGWREFEWRRRRAGRPERRTGLPEWDGRPVDEGAILLYAEEGFGDTIQFVRYAPLVRRLCGKVVVECQQGLDRLLRTAPGVDAAVAGGTAVAGAVCEAPLLSLPRILGLGGGSAPAGTPYLAADPELAACYGRLLVPDGRLRVGIVWAGNPSHRNDRNRSVPLERLRPLFEADRVAAFSLQVGPKAAELASLGAAAAAADLGGLLRDFSDTAAVIENLDLIISVDTAVAHLAGALGKPVWLLLPFAPDWRWGLQSPVTPWYPTMRIFRQPRPGDWENVAASVRRRLELLAAGGAPPLPAAGEQQEAERRRMAVARRETDFARWEDPAQLDPAWEERVRQAARLIPPGARVVDLGCGAMLLERRLPAGCSYVPCDLVRRDERTVICDLNRGQLPDFRDATHIALLGVLEYIFEPDSLLRKLRRAGLPLILSYSPWERTRRLDRPALGWVNELSLAGLIELVEGAGFQLELLEAAGPLQVLMLLRPAGQRRLDAPRVLALSYNNLGNFGDRLGYHMLHSVLPPAAVVEHAHFDPWDAPGGEFDLLVIGAGNSLYPSLLRPEMMELLNRSRRAIGVFGTQYRHSIEPEKLTPVLERLDHWYARCWDDVERFGGGRRNVSHLGDWLIDLFPMARGEDPELLVIGDEIWRDLPLDRTIQRIQQRRRVLSTRVHPLLCALTSAEEVAYREQREDGSGKVSGKFGSMLRDVFGKEYPEEVFFEVDRAAVAAYKELVRRNVEEMRRRIRDML